MAWPKGTSRKSVAAKLPLRRPPLVDSSDELDAVPTRKVRKSAPDDDSAADNPKPVATVEDLERAKKERQEKSESIAIQVADEVVGLNYDRNNVSELYLSHRLVKKHAPTLSEVNENLLLPTGSTVKLIVSSLETDSRQVLRIKRDQLRAVIIAAVLEAFRMDEDQDIADNLPAGGDKEDDSEELQDES